jgi:arginyl-tRNA synthetase
MNLAKYIQDATVKSLETLYGAGYSEKDFQINHTKPEFEGDYTIVLFALVKALKKSPEAIGDELGKKMTVDFPHLFSAYNVIKGFLNLTVCDSYWIELAQKNHNDICFGKQPMNGKKVMVEYSSPNTNKPLHLGHLRNNFLGWSVAEILKANGFDVIKSCIVNDRGIHICKSMIAWQLFANGATPESTHTKGDHFVGEYYVKFNEEYKKQIAQLVESGMNEADAEKNAPIMLQTQQMLVDWENGKHEVMELWKMMNSWVYEGFDITYKSIGCDFDKTYYESETYLLGKDIVHDGLNKNIFFKKEDGSVWIDLTTDGLDEKLVMRKDGTSVYITQDIGLAKQKYDQYQIDQSIYVIGDEQNYHMKVLKLIAQKLSFPYANDIHHLSYGMVELPSGKMKSREGTVVDADDMVEEMINTAKALTTSLGKVKDFNEVELNELYNTLGLGAMKFYLLRVDPKKKMIFNPEESIDFHGFTGPFIQYTYARIQSILRKENNIGKPFNYALLPLEKKLAFQLEQFPSAIIDAAKELNPSVIANYLFGLSQQFNSFYAEHSIANAESADAKNFRLQLASMTSNVIKSGMQLLGIQVPSKM